MKLSVAICTFNGERFIEEQLLSIVNQELPVDEIAICDDGSKDHTIEIVRSIADKNPHVSWIIQRNIRNLGVTKNFERALSLCTGDVCFLSDQDDIWMPSKTKKITSYFEKHPNVNLVFTDAEIIDEHSQMRTGKTLFDVVGFRRLLEAWDAGLQFEIENIRQRFTGCTFGIRKSFIEKCMPFATDMNHFHDSQLVYRSILDDCNGYIDECLVKYRLHQDNVCGLGWKIEPNKLYRNLKKIDELFEPIDINPLFLVSIPNKIKGRILFFQKRKKNYYRIMGKILLLFSIAQYIKFYRQFWWQFYLSDLLYGISRIVRMKIVSYA